jgi:hypothetical protein
MTQSTLKAITLLLLTLMLVLALVAVVNTVVPAPAAAAIEQKGTATTATVTNNASLTIAKPTGVVAGDVLIANLVQVNSVTPPTAPADWTLIDQTNLGGGNRPYASVFYKVAGGSEGADYTFTVPIGATVTAAGGIVAFSGVDTSGATPFDVAPGTIQANTSSGTATAAGITTVSDNVE